jgi:tetratricopeptide (TPR) repeat protein
MTSRDAPHLHGRDEQLRALEGGLERALGGRGQIALVSGEAGIGKSALAAAVARDAEARGAAVTWGRAWEFADAPPYFPIQPCLQKLGVTLPAEAQGHAYGLWESVVASLARVAATSPAVWILEDMHAADLGTLDLLTFLVQPLRAMRVFVVVTVRAKDPRLTDRMQQRLTRMARDGLDVRLAPLSEEGVARLAEETIGEALSARGVKQLAELTGGNPLFVVECARAYRSSGRIEVTLRSLPPTVRQVVLDRVELMPDSTRDALSCGAVLGREFSAALVGRMCDALPARVIDTLLPALRSGLVEEVRPGQFIFGHVLTRDAIEDDLGGEKRAELHARADAALSTLGDTADVLVERARHALAALRAGDEERTMAISQRATTLLEREGAFDRAYELHVRMAEARASGLLPPASLETKLHVASIAHAAGRMDACRRLCEEVAEEARDGKAELLARAALLYGAEIRIGFVDRSHVALLEEAHEAVKSRSPTLGCRVLARLAAALVPAPDPMVPVQIARDAIQQARQTNDEAVIREVLDLAGWTLDYVPADERILVSTELLERALRADDLPRALNARTRLALDHCEIGDFDAFERDTETMLALADEAGHPRHRWRPLLLAATRATALGDFAEADRYVTEATELAALIDDPGVLLSLALHAIMCGRTRRADSEQAARLDRLVQVSSDIPQAPLFTAVTRATVAARMGDVETTRAQLAILGARASMLFGDRAVVGLLAEAYALAGTDEERRAVRAILTVGPTDLSGGQGPFSYEGSVLRLLGLLDASLGDLASAEKLLREARGLAVKRRHAPWVAQLSFELAKVLRRGGGEAEALALLDECAALARKLGMQGLERGVDTSSTSGGISAASAEVRMEREGDIWRIERDGATATVKDSRGMRLLARLVERPGEEVHVLVLASDDGTSVPESTAGDMLDERARKAYRQRLVDLEEDIAEAESHADVGRLGKLQREREALHAEIARATGRGGRARQAASATERARVNVQKRVKDAIARIAEANDVLGRFLESTVSTGTFCCFKPR